jgi:predicted nucleic acid-binding protein
LTRLLIDTSVVLKWFHSDGEAELVEARTLRTAHLRGDATAHVLDLGLYEVGNVLVRALGWSAGDVADQLDDLLEILGTPMVVTNLWLRDAAVLATTHGLTFNDAAWAAAARGLGISLVSAHRQLLAADLAESPTDAVRRLRFSPH